MKSACMVSAVYYFLGGSICYCRNTPNPHSQCRLHPPRKEVPTQRHLRASFSLPNSGRLGLTNLPCPRATNVIQLNRVALRPEGSGCSWTAHNRLHNKPCSDSLTNQYMHSLTLRALGDERHMLLECPALPNIRDEYSPLVAECTGVMARLVWARNQPMVRP